MNVWEQRAHAVIGALCFDAWDKANPRHPTRGRPKKHRPYRVPPLAEQLVVALGIHDTREREVSVKTILAHHDYLKSTDGHDV